ncbi:MAG: TIGR00730 family Rossman fold protein [Saprospiraceae bacterium]|nr:TIGR00730 family Rossman fold protein [Saprospiraceae bacterium]MCB0544576.1 TIGR00730 family Rossman fold protein [Saprospiraceae bacterium]MCB0575080.1 TIGR00730 family Rossman fold protein [Saprospiraceae bacterium]MCB9353712.1 TIGR00730 family Rossman fold protein [Lewinellaceae bacterium]
MKTIAVFCGANKGAYPWFEEAAITLGKTLAERGIRAMFGGGSVGLMGVLADAVLANGGAITGVITHQLHGLELGHPGVTDMIHVETMSERRVLLLRDTDGVITLPGGYGSMDEHFEALTLAQLHQYRKPIGLLNVRGYYDPMLRMLDNMVECGFLKPDNRQLCLDSDTVSDLLDKMEAYEYKALQKWL